MRKVAALSVCNLLALKDPEILQHMGSFHHVVNLRFVRTNYQLLHFCGARQEPRRSVHR